MYSGVAVAFFAGLPLAVLAAFQSTDIYLWALALIWSGSFVVLNLDTDADRETIRKTLLRRDPVRLYGWLTEGLLTTLGRMMAPATAQDQPCPERGWWARLDWYTTPRARDHGDLAALKTSAFSWPVMDTALKIAIIYPLLLLLLQWGLTGQQTGIAGFAIFPAEDRIWLRSALIGPLVLSVIFRLLASASQRRVYESAADWLFWIAVPFVAGSIFASLFTDAIASAVTLLIAIVFAAHYDRVGVVALTAASAFVVVLAGSITASVLLVEGLMGAVGASGAVLIVAAIAFAVTFAVAGALAVAGAGAVGWACQRGRGRMGYALLIAGLWAALVIVFALTAAALDDTVRPLVFALGLLPLVNAVFDYLSYGLTLTLLARGRRWRDLRTGVIWLVDAGAAVALLIALGLALVLTLALINRLAGAVFFDPAQIIADLRDPATRGQYTWLTLSLMTTLVPTLVHLALALFSALTWVPYRFRRLLADLVAPPPGLSARSGNLPTLLGTAIAALLATAYAALVGWGLWAIWHFFASGWVAHLGMAVLDSVEGLGRALGAL